MAGAIHRTTARVLPVSPDGEVLLLQDQDPARPGVLRWGSIGGALDPGETHEQAAVREVREETGIVVDPALLVGPVDAGSHAFSWNGQDYISHSSYFAVPLGREVHVSFAGLEPLEVGNVLAWDWWTADDLEASGSQGFPELCAMMRWAVDAVREAGR
jgi:8-oxo-dGTP pyrophosphatase MutT (NUDIX family)